MEQIPTSTQTAKSGIFSAMSTFSFANSSFEVDFKPVNQVVDLTDPDDRFSRFAGETEDPNAASHDVVDSKDYVDTKLFYPEPSLTINQAIVGFEAQLLEAAQVHEKIISNIPCVTSMTTEHESELMGLQHCAEHLAAEIMVWPDGLSPSMIQRAIHQQANLKYAIGLIQHYTKKISAPVPPEAASETAKIDVVKRASEIETVNWELAKLDKEWYKGDKLIREGYNIRNNADANLRALNKRIEEAFEINLKVYRQKYYINRDPSSQPTNPIKSPPPPKMNCHLLPKLPTPFMKLSEKVSLPCVYCNGIHHSFLCFDQRFNTLHKRKQYHRENKICERCLKFHFNSCRLTIYTKFCRWLHCMSQKHSSELCPEAKYPVTRKTAAQYWVLLKTLQADTARQRDEERKAMEV